MSGVAAAILGGSALTAGAGIFGSLTAAKQQQKGQQAGINALMQLFQQGKDEVQPFVDYGKSLIPTLKSLLTPGPGQTDTLSQLPGFKFLQDWGQQATKNIGSSRGLGGNVGTALAQFATGTAQNAGLWPLITALQGGINTGATSASSILGSGVTAGGNVQAGFGNIGNAQAAGTLGSTNALGSLFGTVGNISLLDALTGGKVLGMYGQKPAVGNGVG